MFFLHSLYINKAPENLSGALSISLNYFPGHSLIIAGSKPLFPYALSKWAANSPASFFALSSYASLSSQVFLAFHISESTPGQLVGTMIWNNSSSSYSTLVRSPLRAAFTRALVKLMSILAPTPYGPPLQPVFTKYT